jgi:hypothetical protein
MILTEVPPPPAQEAGRAISYSNFIMEFALTISEILCISKIRENVGNPNSS